MRADVSEPFHLILSPEALGDLVKLHAFIAADSPDAAAKMVGQILHSIQLLETIPQRQKTRWRTPRQNEPVRSLPVWPYVVFFRVIEQKRIVRILTIRHGARRRPRRFE